MTAVAGTRKLPSRITVGIIVRFSVRPVTTTDANQSKSPMPNTVRQPGTPAGRWEGAGRRDAVTAMYWLPVLQDQVQDRLDAAQPAVRRPGRGHLFRPAMKRVEGRPNHLPMVLLIQIAQHHGV